MFDIVKNQVSLLEVFQKDTELSLKQLGDKNWAIEEEREHGGCPFCNHNDCFRIHHNGENESAFFKCFSCGENGDVIKWRALRKNLSMRDAALDLGKEYELSLPTDYNPLQEIFNLAAGYYENCFWVECNKPYIELARMTPPQYQMEVRKHSEETLRRFHVGWSDGGLIEYLEGIGFDSEILDQSGLRNKKSGKDFLPAKCFIYPHYVKGRVSHFTFKDPLKKLSYQLPKKNSLNGYMFFNQDSIKNAEDVIIVEGENDVMSVDGTGDAPAVIGTIGQISGEQLDWIRETLAGKNVITIFDPDDAGDKYRIKVEKLRRFLRNLAHVKPPEEEDIDHHLANGKNLLEIIRSNLVKVDPNGDKKDPDKPKSLGLPWDTPVPGAEAVASIESHAPDGMAAAMAEAGLSLPTEAGSASSDEEVESDNGDIILKRGAYYKVKFVEGVPTYRKISNFYIHLANVFIEDGVETKRTREILIIKESGYKSRPVKIDSKTKVNLAAFKVMVADAADATFRGTEDDLATIWQMVESQTGDKEVNVTNSVGRHDDFRGWIFRNVYISDSGVVSEPDKDGIFWLHGHSKGVRPNSLNQKEVNRGDIPYLETALTVEEKNELLEGVINNLARNLGDLGKALMMIGWIHSNIYSNMIFDMNKGFPFLFLWGTHGKGKSTVAEWLMDFFGMSEHGSTSVPQLRSAAGWGRKAAYYASLPLKIDEVRSNPETQEYLGLFRSYYDREGRTMAAREGGGVQTQEVNSNFIFVGEDQFADPATRERAIPIRIPKEDERELVESYKWFEDHRHLLTGITYHWILDACSENKAELKVELRSLDKALVNSGCPQRISKNWAVAGVFARRLAQQFCPEFDFDAFIVDAAKKETVVQKGDSTVSKFWGLVETATSCENSRITGEHITSDKDYIYVWYSAIFDLITERGVGKSEFSKQALLSAIREEKYFIKEGKKVALGMNGVRRSCLVFDIHTAPESVRNAAECPIEPEEESE